MTTMTTTKRSMKPEHSLASLETRQTTHLPPSLSSLLPSPPIPPTDLVGGQTRDGCLEDLCGLGQALETGGLVGRHLGGGDLVLFLDGLGEHGHSDPALATLKHTVAACSKRRECDNHTA